MSTPVAKKLSLLGLTVVFIASCLVVSSAAHTLASSCPGDSNPSCVKPYVKATGGDLNTGGWFNDGNQLCDTSTTSNYQDSNFSSATQGLSADGQGRYGGIMTWAKESGTNSSGGSSGEFAAYALGEIEGNDAARKGFYTGGAQAKANSGATYRSYLSFANSVSSPPADFWGGLMVPPGGVRQTAYCIPDYYTSKMPSPVPPSLPACKATQSIFNSDGDYALSSACGNPIDLVPDTTGNVTVQPGVHLTIFVKGNVYIGHNITYAAHDADHVPKFALVVQGSIYIGKGVSQLDGLYVAQPDPSDSKPAADDTGNIWTCHPNDTEAISYIWPAENCLTKLVVNGAFIAKQVELLRTVGDVESSSYNEDSFSGAAGSNAAEVVNYSPDMVIDGPFFPGPDEPIDSLTSLPPVF